MAIAATQVTATDPAVVLAENTRASSDAEYRTTRHVLKNITGTSPIYLGGEGVDESNGFIWEPADGLYVVELEPGEAVYGFGGLDQVVHVLSGGR